MDIFNSNRKLEELVMFGVDWGVFLRHDMESPISPFIYLKDGENQYIRSLMVDGDPVEFAFKILEKEEKPFQQFIIGFEGNLVGENNERTDAIIVHGYDVTQEKGVVLGQMFLPKEKGAFSKISKVTFLGSPELKMPVKVTDNPDYSVEEIGFNGIALKDKKTGLVNYVAVLTHDNPSIITATMKRFLRSKFSSPDSNKLSGEFKIQIPDNCVKDESFLAFAIKNAIREELAEENTKNWSKTHGREVTIEAKYNDKILFEAKSNHLNLSEEKSEEGFVLSGLSTAELDLAFVAILQIPNARTNIEALTKMSKLLAEYKKRGIETPDKRSKTAESSSSASQAVSKVKISQDIKKNPEPAKKWWEFWK
ncbi:hypothetical protein KO500_09420 [Cellulophaga baltica]|uniref:hypothetical protein n=1 Tax=Cellulophaga TaxID=104264 RepID=UPI001C06D6E9|nr:MULTISPECIES: hypothetical protein [Cellulophaga]MBU2996655.1 hypothetical protein [Cellulophaga baltica]MDO6768049.1 hypothetical protein [Cellulophaga sp. 1_MG-2023]